MQEQVRVREVRLEKWNDGVSGAETVDVTGE